MSKKLYVGNLPYTATEDDLRTLFAEAGEVADVAVIKDAQTGRSKGFGFVEMARDSDAEEAIRQFNGYMLENRNLTVDVARPREGGGGGGGAGGGGGRGGYRRDDDRRGGGGRRRY